MSVLRRFGVHAAVIVGALLLSVAATWPLVTELGSTQRLSDRTLDDYIPYWNCWC